MKKGLLAAAVLLPRRAPVPVRLVPDERA